MISKSYHADDAMFAPDYIFNAVQYLLGMWAVMPRGLRIWCWHPGRY